jgi:hypothetical protein
VKAFSARIAMEKKPGGFGEGEIGRDAKEAHVHCVEIDVQIASAAILGGLRTLYIVFHPFTLGKLAPAAPKRLVP